MKNKKSILAALIILSSVAVFNACNGNKSGEKATTEQTAGEQYQCPMDCEEGKTYSEPGQCPVCGMDMVKVENNHHENGEHHHDH